VLGHVFVKALANCTTVHAFDRAAACAGGTVDSFGGDWIEGYCWFFWKRLIEVCCCS
jgi:hypothetical protein